MSNYTAKEFNDRFLPVPAEIKAYENILSSNTTILNTRVELSYKVLYELKMGKTELEEWYAGLSTDSDPKHRKANKVAFDEIKKFSKQDLSDSKYRGVILSSVFYAYCAELIAAYKSTIIKRGLIEWSSYDFLNPSKIMSKEELAKAREIRDFKERDLKQFDSIKESFQLIGE